jgi:hypothetical protein
MYMIANHLAASALFAFVSGEALALSARLFNLQTKDIEVTSKNISSSQLVHKTHVYHAYSCESPCSFSPLSFCLWRGLQPANARKRVRHVHS